MSSDVTAIVATLPIRAKLLRRALASICVQTLQPAAIVVEFDHEHTGAGPTKNRALAKVTTEWTAVLDDDDVWFPSHLGLLWRAQLDTGADVVYSWPLMDGAADPRPDRFGVPFDADELRRGSFIPTTSLFRTELLKRVGGFQIPAGSIHDDWGAYLALLDAGAMFYHLPVRTWQWTVRGQNTSGMPDRWTSVASRPGSGSGPGPG